MCVRNILNLIYINFQIKKKFTQNLNELRILLPKNLKVQNKIFEIKSNDE